MVETGLAIGEWSKLREGTGSRSLLLIRAKLEPAFSQILTFSLPDKALGSELVLSTRVVSLLGLVARP